MQVKDHYRTLRISRQATAEDIKAAYRGLAKKYHPDKNHGNKVAEETFKEIQEAYSILSDSEKKRKYDLKLKYGEPGPQRNANSAYQKREQPRQGHAHSKRTYTRSEDHSYRPESDRKTETIYKVCFAVIVIMLSFFIYSSFRDRSPGPETKQVVQSKIAPPPAKITSSLSNTDSPYNIVFGDPVEDTLSRNLLYLYNNGNCAAIVCVVENKAPFRTIRNEYIEQEVKFRLDGIPDGGYYLKVYFGNNWIPRGKLPDGTMAGRFGDEKGFRIYDGNGMLLNMKQHDKGGLHTFSSYEFKFSFNDSTSSKSLTAEQFFK